MKPVYFTCYFFDPENDDLVYLYRLSFKEDDQKYILEYKKEGSGSTVNDKWMFDGAYTERFSAVKGLCIHLFSRDRSIHNSSGKHQAESFNINGILDKINDGVQDISIEGNPLKYDEYINTFESGSEYSIKLSEIIE